MELQIQNLESYTREQLEACIAELVNHHFDQLINLLYRLDINEARLKALLSSHPGEDAAKLIAGLIMERQEEKKKSREQFKQQGDIDAEEKW